MVPRILTSIATQTSARVNLWRFLRSKGRKAIVREETLKYIDAAAHLAANVGGQTTTAEQRTTVKSPIRGGKEPSTKLQNLSRFVMSTVKKEQIWQRCSSCFADSAGGGQTEGAGKTSFRPPSPRQVLPPPPPSPWAHETGTICQIGVSMVFCSHS